MTFQIARTPGSSKSSGTSEYERARILAEQVKDLQSWCDANSIIPSSSTTTPGPSLPAAASLASSLTSPVAYHASTSSDNTYTSPSQPASETSDPRHSLPPPAMARPSKRPRPPPAGQGSAGDTDDSRPASPQLGPGGQRLLTDAERRANHIASEQKRRAAIREGYDALANAVPVLRDAVREFESRAARVDARSGGRKKKSAANGGGPLQGGIDVGGERIDGRAGPKSEAIVLTQTVEYLRAMHDHRSALLARLNNALQIAHRSHIDPGPLHDLWMQPWAKQPHDYENDEPENDASGAAGDEDDTASVG